MLVRPRSRSGLLALAVPLAPGRPALALFLSHRHFVAQTASGPVPRLRVQSRLRGQAGQWHRVRGRGEGTWAGLQELRASRTSAHSQVSLRWDKTRIQLGVNGVWAQSREETDKRHRGLQAPQPHTLFVGGLPLGSQHSHGLPVRALPAQPPHAAPSPARPGPPPQQPQDLTPGVPCPPGGCEQRPVQRLCEEAGTGQAVPADPPHDGGGHALPLRTPGTGPLLRQRQGIPHSRCVCRAHSWLGPGGAGRGPRPGAGKGPGAASLLLTAPPCRHPGGRHAQCEPAAGGAAPDSHRPPLPPGPPPGAPLPTGAGAGEAGKLAGAAAKGQPRACRALLTATPTPGAAAGRRRSRRILHRRDALQGPV